MRSHKTVTFAISVLGDKDLLSASQTSPLEFDAVPGNESTDDYTIQSFYVPMKFYGLR